MIISDGKDARMDLASNFAAECMRPVLHGHHHT
jgi:hypothetical protein